MKHFFQLLLIFFTTSIIALPSLNQNDQKLVVNNTILAKVDDKSISTIDVMKKLDLFFQQNYPQLADSSQAKAQFYTTGWKQMLSDMIIQELILLDAKDKKISIPDGEVREELDHRYGPNILNSLESLKLSYEEAFNMIKDELLLRRMNWYQVHSKARQRVSPQLIREAYKLYLSDHPAKTHWSYQTVTIKTSKQEDLETLSNAILNLCEQKNTSPDTLKDELKNFENQYDGAKISISSTYKTANTDASAKLCDALSSLQENSYSKIIPFNRNKKSYNRIYFVSDINQETAPTFEEIASKLKDGLFQEHVAEESKKYHQKLLQKYELEKGFLLVPEEFEPFSLK
ncbi:MAG TPA: SurA N-terminal domain-containing protein [Chlamydiales bacterium]|nr:SurA N-terminal domain-containing protein [Chlamydiales bacterium]